LLCIRVAKGNVLTVADIGAKRIEVAIKEPTFLLEAEQKAACDARYAARKAAKKQRRRGY
jgi:hypothetical protein